jgi:DNA-binding NtrC family response regulator
MSVPAICAGFAEEDQMATILCVADGRPTSTLMDEVARLGHEVEPVNSVGEGLDVLDRQEVDLIISDSRVPGSTGLALLDALRRRDSSIPVIIVSGAASLDSAIVSMQRGATCYLARPYCVETLRRAVASALMAGEPGPHLALARK